MAKKILTHFDSNFERYIMAVLLALLTCTVAYDVICRYVLDAGQAFVQELARYTMMFMIFVGIPYGMKYSAHLRADIIASFLPKTKKVFDVVGDAFMVVFGLLLIIWGLPKFQYVMEMGQTSAVLRLPIWILYFVFWLGWVLMCARFAQKYILKIYRFKHGIQEEDLKVKGIL